MKQLTFNDTTLSVWEERDRLHIALENKRTGKTIAEWWDADAQQMFDDGYFKRGRTLHQSAYDYCIEMGIIGARKNPSVADRFGKRWMNKQRKQLAPDMQRANKLFRDFTGRNPEGVKQFRLPEMPKTGVVFGQLIQVGYRSARDGQLYQHTFKTHKSRPLLIASSDGKQVLIVGGRFAFTERGIVDK